MSPISPGALESIAAELATGAGALLKERYFGKIDLVTEAKDRTDGHSFGDVVSEADQAAHDHIACVLATRRPDDLLMSEEGDDVVVETGRYTWIVDPLDGTMNFTLGNPHWCVSAACADGTGRVVAGAVYDPCRDELFAAHLGGGARMNGRTIAVRSVASLHLATVVMSLVPGDKGAAFQRAVVEPLARATAGARSLWSPALDLCWLAAGRVHAFAEWSLKPWDIAAGQLIVEEAGGACEQWPEYAGLLGASKPNVLTELSAIVRGG
jgi:myo-inositol-1(or 4)-monophosphatase